jgi:hypothetical protein
MELNINMVYNVYFPVDMRLARQNGSSNLSSQSHILDLSSGDLVDLPAACFTFIRANS